VVVVSGIVIFSIFCSEILIPWANLQFYSRFYDIRRSKPTVTFEEGVFNDEFNDYTIRIGKKDGDGRHIHQVLIYGNKGGNVNLINQTRAQSGEMFNTPDKQFIVMKLYDGIQYQETSNSNANKIYPFVRVKFKSWQKAFDLTQFERVQTDQDAFKNHQKMLGSRDLLRSVDSIGKQTERRKNDYKNEILMHYSATRPLLQSPTLPTTVAPVVQPTTAAPDSKTLVSQNVSPPSVPAYRAKPTKKFPTNFYDTQRDTTIEGYRSIIAEAASNAEHLKSGAETAVSGLRDIHRSQEHFLYELYMKYASAIICLIFLFIGAPMGAIIQKGGFGYPILVAIGFFMVYMIATIYFRNAFKSSYSISAIMAAVMPCLVVLPFAIYLTWRSVNDYKLDKITMPDWLMNSMIFLQKKFAKKRPSI
jgi:lipopolysaccharide export system permease protein